MSTDSYHSQLMPPLQALIGDANFKPAGHIQPWYWQTLPRTPTEARAVSARTYWTGKVCPNRHLSFRYTAGGACALCEAKKRRERTPEALRRASLHARNWQAKNRERVRAAVNARDRRVRQATPAWADMRAIRSFYLSCPAGMAVDHIIPLRGETVCGLHVLNNLQYLDAIENIKKGNRFDG